MPEGYMRVIRDDTAERKSRERRAKEMALRAKIKAELEAEVGAPERSPIVAQAWYKPSWNARRG